MLFLTHFLFGLLLALIVRSYWEGGSFILFLFLVLFGSILPDIDERKSKIVQWSGIIGRIISFFSRHRGFFHSLFFVVLITLLALLFLNTYYGFGFFLGLVSHLVLDGMTKQGIVLLYPFPIGRIRGWIKTGGILEWVLRLLIVLLIISVLL